MTLGGYEVQFFVTVLVILACAFVALLMDYVKGSHEQLRERHVDLLVRQERFSGVASTDVSVLAETLESAMAQQTAVLREIVEEKRKSGFIEPKKPVEKAPPVHLRDIPVEQIPEPKRTVAPQPVAEDQRVKISLVPEPQNVIPFQVLEPVAAPVAEPAALENDLAIEEQSQQPEPAPDLEAMLEAMMASVETPAPPIKPAANSARPVYPTGMQPPEVLADLVAHDTPFQGQVLSIGINDFAQMKERSAKAGSENYLANVDNLLRSFLRNDTHGQNFLVRAEEDEYLLVEPGLTGPYAQRRLNEISEKLWDFQLRNLGNFSVVFSWGAQEAESLPLAEVIEQARERMMETRTNRRNSSVEKTLRRLATA